MPHRTVQHTQRTCGFSASRPPACAALTLLRLPLVQSTRGS
jgi:hypothetical protein